MASRLPIPTMSSHKSASSTNSAYRAGVSRSPSPAPNVTAESFTSTKPASSTNAAFRVGAEDTESYRDSLSSSPSSLDPMTSYKPTGSTNAYLRVGRGGSGNVHSTLFGKGSSTSSANSTNSASSTLSTADRIVNRLSGVFTRSEKA